MPILDENTCTSFKSISSFIVVGKECALRYYHTTRVCQLRPRSQASEHRILKLPFHPHFFLVLQFSSDHLQLSGVILIVGSVRVKIWANIYRPGQKHQIWCETSLDNCENILMRKHFLFDLWRSRSKSKISKYLNFIF